MYLDVKYIKFILMLQELLMCNIPLCVQKSLYIENYFIKVYMYDIT